MRITHSPEFQRRFDKLDPWTKQEVIVAVERFGDRSNHQALRVRKLKGRLQGRYSFSVNYRLRILFTYQSPEHAWFISIGDHSLYNR